MNIIESVVGCFVGLWCLFATRCEGVLVSGVYREFVVLFGLPRYISFIHNICINLCCCLMILFYPGYPLSHPFTICIAITSINWLTYMYSHFLVITLPNSLYWAQRKSALALGYHFYIVSLVEGAGHYVTGVFVVFTFHLGNNYALKGDLLWG